MKIEAKQIKVREVFDSYADNGDDGVFAYGGRLAIRPPYQREFVYNNEQAEAVIQTVLKGFPLNVMYWVRVGNDSYEVLDGQQRTLSVMQYLKHQFSITLDGKKYYWDALPDDKYNAIMNYEFMVYICEGEESEKLEWFKVVNIAGEKLSDQELRNSVYTGEWLSDAKRHFSKRNCAAKLMSDKYITGDPNRQELLEKALKGICEYQGIKEITEYISWQNGMRAERYFCFGFPWTIITGISLLMTASARRNGGLRVCSTRSIRRRMIFARSIKKIREPTRCCSPQISAHCCRWRSAR